MRSFICYFLLLLTGFSPLIIRSQNTFTGEQMEVNKTVMLIGKAWTQNNLDTLEKYISANYKHTDVRGQLQDRKTWLADVAGRKEKHVVLPDIEFEDTQIQINGDYAMVTGINRFSGNAIKKLRYTQVLKKEQGIWKRILFQATYIE